jgi:predicted nucleic acid-binding protein
MKAYEMDVITRNEAISAIQELVKAGLWISPEVLGEVLTSLED